ncbi:putative immunity protein [Actinopolyspora biskrensis]|uniref:putative immunity protein n=1 Tax=Actinopolyspora biskrensis TaxID=1470178 RepID=UPI0031B63636
MRDVLAVFEEVCPGDGRPRAAVEAARAFAGGAVWSTWQRVAALEAHRAAGAAAEQTSATPVVPRGMRPRRLICIRSRGRASSATSCVRARTRSELPSCAPVTIPRWRRR